MRTGKNKKEARRNGAFRRTADSRSFSYAIQSRKRRISEEQARTCSVPAAEPEPVREEDPLQEIDMRRICRMIRYCGASGRYKGYPYLAEAIRIAVLFRMDGRTFLITKDIYPAVSRRFHVPKSRVESDIRTIITRCWIDHRSRFEEIAGTPLAIRPSNAAFIEMAADALVTPR